MTLEQALGEIHLVKENFTKIYDDKNKIFSGIKSIDKLFLGFDIKKKYLIVGQQGMALQIFTNTVKINIQNLYKKEIDTNFLSFKYLENTEALPVTLKDLSEETIREFDVISSLFRLEYYKIEQLIDGSSSENVLEIQVLKNTTTILPKEKVVLYIKDKRVKSIKERVSFFEKFTESLKAFLDEEVKEKKL